MKRIILSALVAVFSLCANAQYEAEEGDIAVEVGFNPFSTQDTSSLTRTLLA